MPRAARTDSNHTDVVKALRKAGCRVQSLASVGKGVPDLLVGSPTGRLVLLEVKDGAKVPSARKRTPDQVTWHEAWSACPVFVVLSPEEAVRCCL